jgi:hypothetical protein
MAGYDGFSMSNNAREAYRSGLVTAKLTGVPAHLVREFCRYEEWHHTSSRFNVTRFYNREYVRATFGLEPSEDYDANPDAVAALEEYRRGLSSAKTYDNCRVSWLEWGGTRKHPVATRRSAEGCRVTVKGVTATIETPEGKSFRKRLKTRGFWFKPAKESDNENIGDTRRDEVVRERTAARS